MLSIMYVSQGHEGLTGTEVETIAGNAAVRNKEHDVTGMLAYNSLSFMQLLEGDGDNVLSIMRRIEADHRHHSITFIRQDERESRECPDWSMRSLITPMTGARSATVFTGTLPASMELDTKILFTSFASQLSADKAAALAETEEAVIRNGPPAQND